VSVALAWNANSEPDIAGYRLRYGTSSGSYPQMVDVGKKTTGTISNLTAGSKYYIVVSAYNTAGTESRPSNEVTYAASEVGPVFRATDLNRDGRSDLVWMNKSATEVSVWLMSGATILKMAGLGKPPSNSRIVAVADLLRKGQPQIIWSNGSSSCAAWSISWSAGYTQGISATTVSLPANYPVLTCGDFNRDGFQDVLQFDPATSTALVEKLSGASSFATQWSTKVGTAWVLIGAADLNGDGRDEIVWRNKESGHVSAWAFPTSGSFQPQYLLYAAVPLTWNIRAIGKVDFTPSKGLIWHHALTESVVHWKLNLNAQAVSTTIRPAYDPWTIEQGAYSDGVNGSPQIILTNRLSGTVAVRRFNGASATSTYLAVNPGTTWALQPD
jgi:hypothetical protein